MLENSGIQLLKIAFPANFSLVFEIHGGPFHSIPLSIQDLKYQPRFQSSITIREIIEDQLKKNVKCKKISP